MSRILAAFIGCLSLFLLIFNLGCGSAATANIVSPAPSPTPATQAAPQDYVVYASTYADDYEPGGLYAFHVDGVAGSAASLPGSPFASLHGISKLMVSPQNNFLLADSLDSIDFEIGLLGANRGLYSFPVAPDGSLATPMRLSDTYFPATLSASGSFLYRTESPVEYEGFPLALTVYSANADGGSLKPQPIPPVTISGQEFFDGELTTDANGFWIELTTDANGFWIKTGNGNTNAHFYQHFQIDSSTGAISNPQDEVTGPVDMYSTVLAASPNFLIALDGTSQVQNMVRFWAIQNSTATHLFDLTNCGRSSCPDLGSAVAIHPGQQFFYMLNSDTILTVPLSLAAGPDFNHAKSTPLAPSQFNLGGTLMISPDGKLLALGRFHELNIFMVSANGSLTPVAGSPFPTPLTSPPTMAIATLPHQ